MNVHVLLPNKSLTTRFHNFFYCLLTIFLFLHTHCFLFEQLTNKQLPEDNEADDMFADTFLYTRCVVIALGK